MTFRLPESYLKQAVHVNYNIPMPSPDGRGVGFIGIEGTVQEDGDGCFILVTNAGQEILVVKAMVQSIVKASAIERPKLADVARIMDRR